MALGGQGHCRAGLAKVFPNQDAEVLAGSDEMVLNLLTPEAAPARAFETMRVGSIGKTAFDQMLASATISQGCLALALSPSLFHFWLTIKTLNPPATLGLGALRAQCTHITSAGFGHILIGLFLRPLLPAFHLLACRTPVSVRGRVVTKLIFGEEFGPLLGLILRIFAISHVRLNALVHTG